MYKLLSQFKASQDYKSDNIKPDNQKIFDTALRVGYIEDMSRFVKSGRLWYRLTPKGQIRLATLEAEDDGGLLRVLAIASPMLLFILLVLLVAFGIDTDGGLLAGWLGL